MVVIFLIIVVVIIVMVISKGSENGSREENRDNFWQEEIWRLEKCLEECNYKDYHFEIGMVPEKYKGLVEKSKNEGISQRLCKPSN